MRYTNTNEIMSVAMGGFTCLAVSQRGEVFIWGKDLITGATKLLPTRIEAMTRVKARSASVGLDHGLVVTEDGELYSFGSPPGCGHGPRRGAFRPKMVCALHHVRIVAAAAGWGHSLALAEDGTVFSWGKNRDGQLGLSRRDEAHEYMALPQTVVTWSELKVCAIAASNDTSFAVTAAGELYSWGNGYQGKLGHGDTDDQLTPKRVDALRDERMVVVSSGLRHTIAVSRDGGVFGWGEAAGLGLPVAATCVVGYVGTVCILSPCHYTQLSCVQRD